MAEERQDNRVIQINYPGTGNNSQFSYDGLGNCVEIIETSGGSTTSTKQFVLCGNSMCEARNASGTITAQYFALGETISGTSYFYTREHPGLKVPAVDEFFQQVSATGHPVGFNPVVRSGSVCEMTDSSGNIQAEYAYDPYGRVNRLQGSLASDFQYAGYYFHAPSFLNLTLRRAYKGLLGRWLSRDPIDDLVSRMTLRSAESQKRRVFSNPYVYVANNPVRWIDPSGLLPSVSSPPSSNAESDIKWCNAFCNKSIKESGDPSVFCDCLDLCFTKYLPLLPNPRPDPNTFDMDTLLN
jgi:RHS repeat-associated protein